MKIKKDTLNKQIDKIINWFLSVVLNFELELKLYQIIKKYKNHH